MRILISTWSLQIGGGEVLAMSLAAELHRRGHNVFLFNQRAELIDQAVVQRFLPPGVKVLSMADKPWRSFFAYKINALQQRLAGTSDFYLKRQHAYFADCLKHYKIDVVSSHATFSDQICAPVAAQAGVPLVITEHGEYSQFLLEGRRDFRANLFTAKQILTVSDYCRHILTDAFPDLPSIRTVYNGVVINSSLAQESMRQVLNIPPNAFVFGMVARGVEKKGWKYVVKAFQQLKIMSRDRPLWLVLVGGSDYLKQLQSECEYDANIIFTGQVPNPDFYVSGFDVGLLPTYFEAEALPLAVIEYMVSGKPSIATSVGGIPELLNSPFGPAGQLIMLDEATRTPKVDTLVAAMRRYYEEDDLYQLHADNARTASQQFTMTRCATLYEESLAEAISQNINKRQI